MNQSFSKTVRSLQFAICLALAVAAVLTLSVSMASQENKNQAPKKRQQSENPIKKSQSTPKPRKAQSPTASPIPANDKKPMPHCDWPPDEKEKKILIRQAFLDVLKDSIDNKPLRDRLLKCDPEACTEPRNAVKDKLDESQLGNGIDFPDSLVVIFYEPEKIEGKARTCFTPEPNHCYTILSLPSADTPPSHWTDPKAAFEAHLKCCYEPW